MTRDLSKEMMKRNQLIYFRQIANTFRTQHQLHFSAIFGKGYNLQIRPISPSGGFFRPWAILPKSRLFPAMCTFSHKITSLNWFGTQSLIKRSNDTIIPFDLQAFTN